MSKITAALLALQLLVVTLSVSAQEGDVKPAEIAPIVDSPATIVVLKAGTVVKLKFAQKLSSRAAVVGEPVEFVLAEDLKVGEVTVARKGARVLGTVTAGRKSERKSDAGELGIQIDFLKTGNSQIKLRGEEFMQNKMSKSTRAALIIAFGVGGLLVSGKQPVAIKEGTPVDAYVADDTSLPTLDK